MTNSMGAVSVLARNRRGEIVVKEMRPGLIPGSYDGPIEAWTWNTVHARLETVATTEAFANAWRLKRRIILPLERIVQTPPKSAQGRGTSSHGQRVAITRRDGQPIGVAGIYDCANTSEGRLLSYATLTRTPGPLMHDVNDREPVILERQVWNAWLEGADDLDLATPTEEGTMRLTNL